VYPRAQKKRKPIRGIDETRARDILKKGAHDVAYPAYARSPLRRLVRVCLQPSDQTLQVICRHGLLCDDHCRIARNQRNGLEILQHIVRKGVDSSVHDVRAPLADAKRVAVGRRLGDLI